MKKNIKKLALHRETVQTLTDSLSKVAGASDMSICPAFSCNSCAGCTSLKCNYTHNPDTRTAVGCV